MKPGGKSDEVSAASRKIAEAIRKGGSAMAIASPKRQTSFAQVAALACELIGLLDDGGCGAGGSAMIVSRNRPVHGACIAAMAAAGRQLASIYAFQSPAGIAAAVTADRPAAVLADRSDWRPELVAAVAELGAVGIVLDNDGFSLAAFPGLELAGAGPFTSPPTERGLVILSSGTTGAPKPIHLPYRLIERFLETGAAAAGPDAARFAEVLVMPFTSIGGVAMLLANIAIGRGTMVLEKFTVAAWVQAVEAHRPEYATLPPAALQMLLDADVEPARIASVRYVTGGGARLDPALQQAFEARYGARILWGYGATEFCGTAASWTAELYDAFYPAKRGSAGRALPGVGLRIVDGESGEVLPPGSRGLIEALIPAVQPGWIRTTDIGEIDADGFLYHHGRADGAIVRGGFKIMPEAIIEVLRRFPGVVDAAVAALPQRRLGQVPVAVLEWPKSLPQPGRLALAAFAKQNLVAHHVPVDFLLVDELPRTATMKVDQRALNELAARLRGAGAEDE